jgi:hypothetical protein
MEKKLRVVGIDLAQQVLHLVGLGSVRCPASRWGLVRARKDTRAKGRWWTACMLVMDRDSFGL